MYKVVKDNVQMYLSDPEKQSDRFLRDGWRIVFEESQGNETIVATPDEGWFGEKPKKQEGVIYFGRH